MLMSTSTDSLADFLGTLSQAARRLELTDTEWARRAGVRKETLSRLRSRETCDFATLRGLAEVVGARVGLVDGSMPGSTPDGHFPSSLDRNYENRLLELCASGMLDVAQWAWLGPQFFMAGLAVMLASLEGQNRRDLLALAEKLHPGASEPEVFARWLARSPVKPSRFLPMLDSQLKYAA